MTIILAIIAIALLPYAVGVASIAFVGSVAAVVAMVDSVCIAVMKYVDSAKRLVASFLR